MNIVSCSSEAICSASSMFALPISCTSAFHDTAPIACRKFGGRVLSCSSISLSVSFMVLLVEEAVVLEVVRSVLRAVEFLLFPQFLLGLRRLVLLQFSYLFLSQRWRRDSWL